jgi:spermidine/putrescine transport system ATP-binding protein
LGPSGCGKSTTLRMIAGLEPVSAGTIRIRGEDVTDLPAYRRPTNMVFQNLALFPHLDVRANLAFGLRIQGLRRSEIERRVEGALELVHLPGMAGRRIQQLSGGQQQRVALARAIVNQPTVLLLDEALGSLDQQLRKAMQIEIKTLQRTLGITFILVTHDQHEALVMADRVCVMRAGRLEQVGSGYDLYMRPQSEFVAEFIGETNLLHGTVRQDETGRSVFAGAGLVAEVAAAIPRAAGARLMSLRPESIRVDALAETAVNRYPARIEKLVFLGHGVEAELDAGGTVLKATLPTRQGMSLCKGDHVTIGWDPDDAVLLGH